MQDCFRKHPEIYQSELDDEEADDREAPIAEGNVDHASSSTARSADSPENTASLSPPPSPPTNASSGDMHGEKVTHVRSNHTPAPPEEVEAKRERAQEATERTKNIEPQSETDNLVPKAAHDAR